MKVLVIGASGTIGTAVYEDLRNDFDVFGASRNHPTHALDINNRNQVATMLKTLVPLDGIVVCAGTTPFGPFESLDQATFEKGFQSKFIGQVNVVWEALNYLSPNGAVVLSSGILAREPILGSSCAAAVNGALEAFVMATAAEYLGRMRLNIVSASVVEDAMAYYGKTFQGFKPTSMSDLVVAYRRALTGPISGKTLVV